MAGDFVTEQIAQAEAQLKSAMRTNLATRRIVIFTDLALGLGWLLGPDQWTSAPSFEYLRALNMDIWSVLAIVIGLLCTMPKNAQIGFAWGAFFWSLVAALFVASIPDTQGWGGPFVFGALAWLHVVGAASITPPKYYLDTLVKLVRRVLRPRR